jgi:hypothetical protein|tara:strand:+ start:599 stop:790 length:192 start_codon:yes stop_codon:yes gene_type:complete
MITLIISASIIGAFLTWRHGAKCYDKGITDAVLLHRNGRLTYKTCLDDNGAEMVNIEIESIDG